MPRPCKYRRVQGTPQTGYFKPRGIPMNGLEEVQITVEGLEALRLSDLEGLNNVQAAEHMGVSRHTFGRVLANARQTVARALVGGMALRIEGGHYRIARTAEQSDKEKAMNIVAISSEGPNMSDRVDPRFGRAAGFVIVNTESGETSYLDNGVSQVRAQGAGIQAAEIVAGSGAGVVLTGYVGPKAFQALAAAGIKVAQNLDGMNVAEALEKFSSGNVQMAAAPNSRGRGRS